jgi:nucleoside-diphosphate-sugar epimerase
MPQQLRVAVTGGSGNVGKWLVRCLLDRGHRVVNLDRAGAGDERAQFVQCDIHDRAAIEPVLCECDSVCHLAEIPTSIGGIPKEEVYANNTRAAAVVLQTAAELRLRHAVYASTCQVYGSWGEHHVAPLRLPIDESCPVNPRNVYAASKVANEVFAKYLSQRENFGISVVRFPGIVASKEKEEGLWKYAKWDGEVSDGFCTILHAGDLARGIAAALEACRPGFEVYNLGAEDILSAVPLKDRLDRHHSDFPPLPANWPPLKSPLLIEKAQRLLNWYPLWSFAKYLRERETPAGRQI